MIDKRIKEIPYGTKCIYDRWGSCTNIHCFITGYNQEDDTYNIAQGWDVCHVSREHLTLVNQKESENY